jgi:hypothetical protein
MTRVVRIRRVLPVAVASAAAPVFAGLAGPPASAAVAAVPSAPTVGFTLAGCLFPAVDI